MAVEPDKVGMETLTPDLYNSRIVALSVGFAGNLVTLWAIVFRSRHTKYAGGTEITYSDLRRWRETRISRVWHPSRDRDFGACRPQSRFLYARSRNAPHQENGELR